MNYENFFDNPLDRSGTYPVKWDCTDKSGSVPVIPLWIADMDFRSPPEVSEALKKRAAHPLYGYTGISPAYFETLIGWYRSQYRTELKSGDILLGRGTVPGLSAAVRAFSREGDGVLIFTPVYGPFFDVIRRNKRQVVEAPLKMNGEGRYCFDISETEKIVASLAGVKVPLMLLCSPHNPGGSVWDARELESLLSFAKNHGMVICADEIHGDIIHEPKRFTSLSSFPEHQVVVVSSANKTFNLGGLHASHFVVRDPGLKETLGGILAAEGGEQPDIFSMIAVETAYSAGGEWLAALKKYIGRNIEETVAALKNVSGLEVYRPEGTYLVWVDASALIAAKNFTDENELVRRLEIEGRVKLVPGSSFGERGGGFVRVNVACPNSRLKEALSRIARWSNNRS